MRKVMLFSLVILVIMAGCLNGDPEPDLPPIDPDVDDPEVNDTIPGIRATEVVKVTEKMGSVSEEYDYLRAYACSDKGGMLGLEVQVLAEDDEGNPVDILYVNCNNGMQEAYQFSIGDYSDDDNEGSKGPTTIIIEAVNTNEVFLKEKDYLDTNACLDYGVSYYTKRIVLYSVDEWYDAVIAVCGNGVEEEYFFEISTFFNAFLERQATSDREGLTPETAILVNDATIQQGISPIPEYVETIACLDKGEMKQDADSFRHMRVLTEDKVLYDVTWVVCNNNEGELFFFDVDL